MRVLVIDGDAAARAETRSALDRHGFLCDGGGSCADARSMAATVGYAAILLDPALRDADGLDPVRDLRQRHPDLPLLVLSARVEPEACVAALDAGADDHLAKPCDPAVLAARLRAVLRRGRAVEPSPAFGDLAYDPRTLRLSIAGAPAVVSARERQLVELLMQGGGRLVTKRYAEDQLFGHSAALGSNAIEVYVHRLRRRLRAAGSAVRIETVRGTGYLLRAADP